MKRDMRKYILRKLVELIFTLLFVTLLSFLLMRLSSVDPATAYAKRMIGNPTAEQIEKIRIQLGFDKPLLVQYGRWVWDLLHFDLGVSLANGRCLDGYCHSLSENAWNCSSGIYLSGCFHCNR